MIINLRRTLPRSGEKSGSNTFGEFTLGGTREVESFGDFNLQSGAPNSPFGFEPAPSSPLFGFRDIALAEGHGGISGSADLKLLAGLSLLIGVALIAPIVIKKLA